MTADAPTLTIARLGRVLENNSTPDLSLPQYRVLGLLSGGDERASLLASRLAVAKPTLTSIIDNLVERGYVVRETSAGDRRAVRLSITPAGRAAVEREEAHLGSVLDEVLERCDDPTAVLGAIDQLRRALDARWAERIQQATPVVAGAPRSGHR